MSNSIAVCTDNKKLQKSFKKGAADSSSAKDRIQL